MVKTFYISILSKCLMAKGTVVHEDRERERETETVGERQRDREKGRERGREEHYGNQKS